ncbi:gluconokinase [Janibacter sp. YIM B02568]|uniref:gluconokinase n=1 Tax=Janibacter endophyticus TaxID=2806261 RepID=UPI00194EC5D3|nr:gluconokinase [Janibacter endophyticus]MBM6547153.1 gluconokinase [Janibacter endophyticus]
MTSDPRAVRHIVVMGASGAGKTTLAQGIVDATGWDFLEGDELHPPENVAKMTSGRPLTDEDRWPWLRSVGEWISEREAKGEPAVIACSALRRVYRDLLREGREHVEFLMIEVPAEELHRRLEERTDHYMKASMLQSQLDTLEPLEADEPGVTLRSGGDEGQALADALVELDLQGRDQAGRA